MHAKNAKISLGYSMMTLRKGCFESSFVRTCPFELGAFADVCADVGGDHN